MLSFVYLGIGELDNVPVFKIGKTISPKQRFVALHIELTGWIACLDEPEALALEELLLTKTRAIGAKNLRRKFEWFQYDEAVYQKVLHWFEHDADELLTQIVPKVKVKKKVEEPASAPTSKPKTSSVPPYVPASKPLSAQELQAVIDRQREIIRQLENTEEHMRKRREQYLATIRVLQNETNQLRKQLAAVEVELELCRTERSRAE